MPHFPFFKNNSPFISDISVLFVKISSMFFCASLFNLNIGVKMFRIFFNKFSFVFGSPRSFLYIPDNV